MSGTSETTETAETPPPAETSANVRLAWLIGGGLLVALVLAGIVSNFASGSPDGLDSVLRDGCTFDSNDEIVSGTCGAQGATEHDLGDSPLSDYGVKGVDNSFLSTGLSGVVGVLVTLGIGYGLFVLLRSRNRVGSTDDHGG